MKKQSGYVLLLALAVIAVISLLITSVVTKVIIFNRINKTLIAREQARQLALSGLQIALAQLSPHQEEQPVLKDSKQQNQLASPQKNITQVLPRVAPLLNHWQTFTFTQAVEGIDGMCEVYIASEQGKININALYDFAQKKFISQPVDGFKVCQLLGEKLAPLLHAQDFAQQLGAFFGERGRPLDDLSQLIVDKRFARLKDYFTVEPTDQIRILDLFTIETQKNTLQPWFLSRSLGLAVGFPEATYGDKESWKKIAEKLPQVAQAPWKQKWDTLLMPLFGRDFSMVPPEISGLFAQEFETAPFSVVSYGRFGGMLVKMYAILYVFIEGKAEKLCVKKIYWM